MNEQQLCAQCGNPIEDPADVHVQVVGFTRWPRRDEEVVDHLEQAHLAACGRMILLTGAVAHGRCLPRKLKDLDAYAFSLELEAEAGHA
jgi:hypothetical protein